MQLSIKSLMFGFIFIGLVPLSATAGQVEFLRGGDVMDSSLPFSPAVRVGNTYYLSGQLGVKPGTLELVPGGIREEARQTMENIAAVLAANNLDMGDVVKCTVMLADMSEWGTFNEVYRSFFTGNYPARSAFGSTGLGLGARAEVDCIAVDSKADAHGKDHMQGHDHHQGHQGHHGSGDAHGSHGDGEATRPGN